MDNNKIFLQHQLTITVIKSASTEAMSNHIEPVNNNQEDFLVVSPPRVNPYPRCAYLTALTVGHVPVPVPSEHTIHTDTIRLVIWLVANLPLTSLWKFHFELQIFMGEMTLWWG
jgi:hypothetical protein